MRNKICLIFTSIVILGLIVGTSSFSNDVFAEKPDKEEAKTIRADAKEQREIERADAKEQREIERADAKEQREIERADAKTQKHEIKEFENGHVVGTSSTTVICHIPPGNPANAHSIVVGTSSLTAHLNHGDHIGYCDSVKEFENGYVVGTSSTTVICHIPPGNPANAHSIVVGTSSLTAHLNHGDHIGYCSNENKIKNTTDENLINQLTTQIAELQKSLQELFGI